MPCLRTSLVAAVVLAAMAGSSAGATPPALTEQESIALGRGLAARNCGMCHALERTGPSPSPQAPPFRSLSERFDVELLGEGLATGILTNHPAMPEFRFEPFEVVAIVRYLRSVQAKQRIRLTLPPRSRGSRPASAGRT
jgi:mono/diheme cytochrome c family protein